MATRKNVSNLPVLMAEEVNRAKAACTNYSRLYRAQKSAEKERDACLAQMFIKMGFRDLDEVKSMTPERLGAEIQKRTGVAFTFDSQEAREFAVLKTWGGRYTNWKDQFLARVGPEAAADIEASTRMQYSYAIVDLPSDPAPNVIFLPSRVRRP